MMNRTPIRLLMLLSAVMIILVTGAGCSTSVKEKPAVPVSGETNASSTKVTNSDTGKVETKQSMSSEKQTAPLSVDELKKNKVNESGEVMVIMYHALGKKNEDYLRTPEAFKNDLQTLYDQGFRPVSMKDYISGHFDVEKGKTPVVLTFDDGNVTNFNIVGKDAQERPQLDPNCNVAIMEAFTAKHPDFKTRAIFFLNGGEPFAQKGYGDVKIKYLLSLGMEIGNHSNAHENFTKLSGKQVEITLGKDNVTMLGYLKKAFSTMDSKELKKSVMQPEDGLYALALPFGSRPAKAERGVLAAGSYAGVSYHHQAILNVGWKPEVAPTNKAFNAVSINRVQSGDGVMQLKDWLKSYATHPERRYISDGNPDTLAVPKKDQDKINPEKAKGFKILTY